jgi:hypothetical protein
MEKDGIPVCSSEFGPAHTGHRGDMGFRASRAPHDARVFFSNLHIARTAAAPSCYLIISKSSALFLIEKSGPRSGVMIRSH